MLYEASLSNFSIKRPIAYRVAMYLCIASLVIAILFLLNAMNYAPFTSSDMRLSYLQGCAIGNKPLTDVSISKCIKLADEFESTLISIDRQMNHE